MYRVSIAQSLARLAGLLSIVLGALIWTGRRGVLVPLHIASGVLLVLALWALAFAATRQRAHTRLASWSDFWGLVTLVFGIFQARLLPGAAHWVVQVAHLGVGIAAMGLAEALGVRLRRAQRATV
jgi:hypothetical protein